MVDMPNTRLSVPSTARRGEVIEIKTLIMHPMETGFRVDSMAKPFPKHIIHTFTCTYNGVEVYRVELNTGIAANPYLSFSTVATESGILRFTWYDDDGSVYSKTAEIKVV